MTQLFSKPVPIPAWAIILLSINLHMALIVEIISTLERVDGFSGLYDPEVIGIAIAFFVIPIILYYALYTQRLIILGIILAFDVADLIGKVLEENAFLFERAILFVAFWIVPACFLWINRIRVVRYVRARYTKT